jgi:hypothetical protein
MTQLFDLWNSFALTCLRAVVKISRLYAEPVLVHRVAIFALGSAGCAARHGMKQSA